jgi:hypothetical protein
MKRKVISIIVWLLITVGYIASIRDFGRSVGANIMSAYEYYAEVYGAQNFDTSTLTSMGEAGTKVGNAMADTSIYYQFHNLETKLKGSYTELAIITVIYVIISNFCLYLCIKNKMQLAIKN